MQRYWRAMTMLALAGALSGDARGELLINEVLADPATDWNGDTTVHSRDDEWVEIINTSGTSADLTGVRIASADTTWRYEFEGSLAAGATRVVFGSDAYAWEQESGNPAFGLRFTNTGATIGLWRVSAMDTVLVDEVSYTDDEAEDDRSAGRLDSDPDQWVLYDLLNPYDGEPPPIATGCPPTPGATNECLAPALERTWGGVKSLYAGED